KRTVAHHSRLSKTLAEVLADKGALSYFIQYLEARDGFSLIKFWLDVESFRAAAGAQDCVSCINRKAPGQDPNRTSLCQSHCQNDKLSLSTDSGSVFESPLHSSGSANDIIPSSKDGRAVSLSVGSSLLTQATVDDALRIFNKYISHEAPHPVRVPDVVRDRVVAAICSDAGMVDAESFTELQGLVLQTMETEYFNDFLRSDFHCKHQIDVLTSGNVVLTDILYNETALFYFMEYMEQEGNQSLVQFWLAAVNFEQHLKDKKGDYDSVEAQNDAIVLYDKYFSLQATCPLGFSDRIRFFVEQNICREDGPLPDCFSKPADIVFNVLEKVLFHTSISSVLS
ncbi:hypothetical protein L798_11338, partial [Zootermopsis nevadensis]